MMHYERPRPPPAFVARVAPLKAAVARQVQRRQRPRFADVWREYRGDFATAQHGKCGYCESAIAATQSGAVEHYAPTRGLAELSDEAAEWGAEREGLSKLIRGSRRKQRVIADSGFWWLAYDWDNYLFACIVCNSAYKGEYFPVESARPLRRWRPTPKSKHRPPQLLNCYRDREPWRHFRFDRTGAIAPTSERGRQTIAVCGLFRASLRRDRGLTLDYAYALCERIGADPDGLQPWLDLRRLGRPQHPFAGAVRSIAEHQLDVPWERIEAYVASFALQGWAQP